jgi:hypothetical protein
MPQCVRPEPKRERFEALMALESDLERPKKRRWKPWPRVPPARSVNGLFKIPRGAMEQAIEALL